MDIKRVVLQLTLATVVVMASGCASYRVSSNVDTLPAPTASAATQVLISEAGLADRKFKVLGPIDVSVKKLTVFHKDPTKAQANEALVEKARLLGADAVINVTYASGIGFTTWGYIDAKGTAVKLTE